MATSPLYFAGTRSRVIDADDLVRHPAVDFLGGRLGGGFLLLLIGGDHKKAGQMAGRSRRVACHAARRLSGLSCAVGY